jgi:GNAT superfamily N-acetyltransferase
MRFRPARLGDVPALIGLARRSWRSGFSAAPPEFVREWLAREFEPESYPKYWPTMTVADGVLLGLVQPMKDEVNGLWVDPAAQGHGVGTALLRRAEAEIAAAGYRRVWLTCSGLTRTGYGSMRPAGTAGTPPRRRGGPAGSSRRLRFSSATCSRQSVSESAPAAGPATGVASGSSSPRKMPTSRGAAMPGGSNSLSLPGR